MPRVGTGFSPYLPSAESLGPEVRFSRLWYPPPSHDRKHSRHRRKPEQLPNPRIHPGNTQPDPFALTPDIMTDQHPKPSGIHIRDLCQVKHVRMRIALRRFENIAKRIRRQRVIHIPSGKWPGQPKHRTQRFAFTAFDRESRALPYLRFHRCTAFPSIPHEHTGALPPREVNRVDNSHPRSYRLKTFRR